MSERDKESAQPEETDLDDWETEPDFVQEMNEMDQRWGRQRHTSHVDINKLINEIRDEVGRDKFDHPSQRDYNQGFGGKFGIQHDRKDPSAHEYDYLEKLSKHSSQEVKKSVIKTGSTSVSEAKKKFLEQTAGLFKDSKSPSRNFESTETMTKKTSSENVSSRDTSPTFETTSTTKRITKEEKSSSSKSSTKSHDEAYAELMSRKDLPEAFKRIKEKIDAFKRDYEEIATRLCDKEDLARLLRKTTTIKEDDSVEFIDRSFSESKSLSDKTKESPKRQQSPTSRPTSSRDDYVVPPKRDDSLSKFNIKSLSQKFETLCKDMDEDSKRQTEARRQEFFQKIEQQVRETRKELEGFDTFEDEDDVKTKHAARAPKPSPSSSKIHEIKNTTQPKLHKTSFAADVKASKPKLYTRRETTQEEVFSKVVKENDKIIENETRRSVGKESSFHGSSDED